VKQEILIGTPEQLVEAAAVRLEAVAAKALAAAGRSWLLLDPAAAFELPAKLLPEAQR